MMSGLCKAISRLVLGLTLGCAGCQLSIFDDTNVNSAGDDEPIIVTVAGNGIGGFNGDGLDALETQLYYPLGMEFSPDGRLYIVDWNNHRIRRIHADNTIETIYGSGQIDNLPLSEGTATEANLARPTDIEFEPDSDMLVAVWQSNQIARVHLSAEQAGESVTHSVVAGDGSRIFCCDGQPATMTKFALPSAVAQDPAGNIIIAEQASQRIRRIDSTTGIVETICNSTGATGSSGDGGPAELAQLHMYGSGSAIPGGHICIDHEGSIYVADTHNHRIRKIDSAGIITTVAGTGEAGSSGDGGWAVEAQLNRPVGVAVDTDGSLLIAEYFGFRIRIVAPDGIISTLAGDGQSPTDRNDDGFLDNDEIGDGGPARRAHLARPGGIMVAPNRDVYVADTYNHRIRRIIRSSSEFESHQD